MNEKLFHGLIAIHSILEIEALPKLNKGSQNTPEYFKCWKKIKSIQKELNLSYAYIALKNDKKQFFFVYDTADDPTYLEEVDNYLRIYPDPPSEVFESVETGKFLVLKGQYTNRYGTFKSAFYPIYLNGKPIGVIGVDYELSKIYGLQQKAIFFILGFLFLGIIVVSLNLLAVKYWVIDPIHKLNIGSKKIALGNFDYFISINQKDEIGELAKGYNQMTSELKKLFSKQQLQREKLEERVFERTDELGNVLKSNQELKNQLERNYLVMSLVLDSLSQNRNISPIVKIDYYIEQKEKIFLNGKTFELGGDICIAGNLKFFGKSHAVFFNGDAMGRSIQGISSALVIGTLLNSILLRSIASNRVITKEPNKWLRESFFEIQKVLEAFNGTIFFTCILGVIEEETGIMYYFNSEHPLALLYRNGKANYIEEEITTSMLGKSSNLELGLVKIQLNPNDIILCGSKGKDNLLLNAKSDQSRIINEDNKLFLRVVEDSKGNLNEIYKNLLTVGELTDDLSLLRISYLGNLN